MKRIPSHPIPSHPILKLFLFFIIILSTVAIPHRLDPQESQAPNFAFYRHDGERHVFYQVLDSLPDGGMALLNFTSVTCQPCKKEIPELKGIADAAGNRARLLCVYAEQGETVRESAKGLYVLDRAFVDPLGAVRKNFNVEKIPTTIIVRKDRTVLGRFEGYTKANMEKIKSIVGVK